MKDRIGNVLGEGDRVLVTMPESSIFGFVAKVEDGGLYAVKGGTSQQPGRILVSCVIAIPVDPVMGQTAQLVKVWDPDKHVEAPDGPERVH